MRGRGYNVYVGAFQLPAEIDLRGVIDLSPFNFDLFYTPSGFPGSADGYNFLGNPYPSAIDWDQNQAWTKIGCCDATLIWDECTQQYQSYAQGVGTNGGTPIIGASQGFWVKAHREGAELSCNRGVCVSTPDNFRSAVNTTSGQSILRLGLDGFGESDDCVVRLKSDATYGLDDVGDAPDLLSSSLMMGIYTLDSLGDHLGINSFGFDYVDRTIPVMVRVPQSGVYSLALSIEEEFPTDLCLLVRDNLTGQTITMDSLVYHTFTMLAQPNFTHRFDVIFTYPLRTQVEPLSCYGLSDASIIFQDQGSGPYNLVWTDLNGNVLQQRSNWSGNDTLKNLPAGGYYLQMHDLNAANCAIVNQLIEVEAPEKIKVDVLGQQLICEETEVPTSLEIRGGQAPYDVLWSHGETTENVILSAGNYSVQVTDQEGCVETMDWNISNHPTLTANFSVPDTINMSDGPHYFRSTSVGTVLDYKWQFGDGESSASEHPLHVYLGPGTYELSLIVSNSTCADTVTQEIVVVNTTNIATNVLNESEHYEAFVSGSWLTLKTKFDTNEAIDVSILDTRGRQLVTEAFDSETAPQKQWSTANWAKGTYLIQVRSSQGQFAKKLVVQ